MRISLEGLVVCILGISACGGGGSSGSGLDRSRKLLDLTDAERQRLCDTAPQGPDGGALPCPNGGTSPFINEPAQCLKYLQALNPACVATVGDGEDCAQAIFDNACFTDPAYATKACMATIGCSTTACQGECTGSCDAVGTPTNTSCLAACYQATYGVSQSCMFCIAPARAGTCEASTFPARDAAICLSSCGPTN
jgi:hypothetical protein